MREVGREGVRFHPGDGGGQDADGGGRRRHRRMAAGGLHGQLQGGVALFGDADHGDRRLDARQHADGHLSALIEDRFKLNMAGLQQADNLQRTLLAADFLVVAKREIESALRLEAVGEQALHRLELAHEAGLHIEGPATPDAAFGNLAAEGRVLPVALGAGADRHDILVAHEQRRLQGGILARPSVEQAEAVDLFALQMRMDQREGLSEERVEAVELRPAVRNRGDERFGVELQGGAEPARGRIHLELGAGLPRDVRPPGRDHGRVHGGDEQQRREQAGQIEEKFVHGWEEFEAPGFNSRVCAAAPGRKGLGSPFTQAS